MPGMCPRCCREVYHAEEKRALGSVWHAFCFSCFICRRLLDSCTVNTYNGELFCDYCYRRRDSYLTHVQTNDDDACPCKTELLSPGKLCGACSGPPKRLLCQRCSELSSNVGAHQCSSLHNCSQRCPSLSRCPSLTRCPSLSRCPSLPRCPSVQRCPSLPRCPSVQRCPSLQRCPSIQRCPSVHKCPSFQKCPSLQGSPTCTRRVVIAPCTPCPSGRFSCGTPIPRDIQNYYSRQHRSRSLSRMCSYSSANCKCSETSSVGKCRNCQCQSPPERPCSSDASCKPCGNSLGGGVACRRCSRAVYHAEMMLSSRSIYHNTCFSCFTCRKPLEVTNFFENACEIYCKQCYTSNFGPQGYGYGIKPALSSPK